MIGAVHALFRKEGLRRAVTLRLRGRLRDRLERALEEQSLREEAAPERNSQQNLTNQEWRE